MRITRITALVGAALLTTILATAHADDRDDPNFPGLVSPLGLRIQWNNYDKGNPQVIMPGQDHGASYLGWNDRGSWLVGADDGKIYVWNLKQNSLTLVYRNYKLIPQETVASLKNNPFAVAKGTPKDTGPKPTGPKPVTPDTSRQAAFFGNADALKDALKNAMAPGNTVPQGPPGVPAVATGRISGSGAAVAAGVLTFIDANGTKKSYKVVRPRVAIGPQGSSDAGTWLAIDDQMMFTVLNDKTVSGQKAPPVLFQMLMQQSH